MQAGGGIRPSCRVLVTDSGADLAGAEPPRVAQFYIVDVERYAADRVIAGAIAIELQAPQREADEIAVREVHQAGEREPAAVVVHRVADDPAAVCVPLWIDLVAIGAIEDGCLPREIA